MRTGIYTRADGYINSRVVFGNWWESSSNTISNGYYLYTDPSGTTTYGKDPRGFGFAIRCTIRVE